MKLGTGGLEAVVTLGAGDMRRTLNILQVRGDKGREGGWWCCAVWQQSCPCGKQPKLPRRSQRLALRCGGCACLRRLCGCESGRVGLVGRLWIVQWAGDPSPTAAVEAVAGKLRAAKATRRPLHLLGVGAAGGAWELPVPTHTHARPSAPAPADHTTRLAPLPASCPSRMRRQPQPAAAPLPSAFAHIPLTPLTPSPLNPSPTHPPTPVLAAVMPHGL